MRACVCACVTLCCVFAPPLQALLFLPIADLLNYLNLFVMLAPAFPSSAPTLDALQDVIAHVAGVEKMVWCEGNAVHKRAGAAACVILDPAGLRQFVRQGAVTKLAK